MPLLKFNGFQARELGNGFYEVINVEIFPRTKRVEKDAQGNIKVYDFTTDWLKEAIKKIYRNHHQNKGYLPPIHIGHNEDDDVERENAGSFFPHSIRVSTVEGKPTPVIVANLLVPKDIYLGMKQGKYPFRSIEVDDYENHEINSMALLTSREPWMMDQPLIVKEATKGNIAGSRFPMMMFKAKKKGMKIVFSSKNKAKFDSFEDDVVSVLESKLQRYRNDRDTRLVPKIKGLIKDAKSKGEDLAKELTPDLWRLAQQVESGIEFSNKKFGGEGSGRKPEGFFEKWHHSGLVDQQKKLTQQLQSASGRDKENTQRLLDSVNKRIETFSKKGSKMKFDKELKQCFDSAKELGIEDPTNEELKFIASVLSFGGPGSGRYPRGSAVAETKKEKRKNKPAKSVIHDLREKKAKPSQKTSRNEKQDAISSNKGHGDYLNRTKGENLDGTFIDKMARAIHSMGNPFTIPGRLASSLIERTSRPISNQDSEWEDEMERKGVFSKPKQFSKGNSMPKQNFTKPMNSTERGKSKLAKLKQIEAQIPELEKLIEGYKNRKSELSEAGMGGKTPTDLAAAKKRLARRQARAETLKTEIQELRNLARTLQGRLQRVDDGSGELNRIGKHGGSVGFSAEDESEEEEQIDMSKKGKKKFSEDSDFDQVESRIDSLKDELEGMDFAAEDEEKTEEEDPEEEMNFDGLIDVLEEEEPLEEETPPEEGQQFDDEGTDSPLEEESVPSWASEMLQTLQAILKQLTGDKGATEEPQQFSSKKGGKKAQSDSEGEEGETLFDLSDLEKENASLKAESLSHQSQQEEAEALKFARKTLKPHIDNGKVHPSKIKKMVRLAFSKGNGLREVKQVCEQFGQMYPLHPDDPPESIFHPTKTPEAIKSDKKVVMKFKKTYPDHHKAIERATKSFQELKQMGHAPGNKTLEQFLNDVVIPPKLK